MRTGERLEKTGAGVRHGHLGVAKGLHLVPIVVLQNRLQEAPRRGEHKSGDT